MVIETMRYSVRNIVTMIMVSMVTVHCSVPERYHTPEIPVELLHAGDIAFRRGEGFASDIVTYKDRDGKYSHVGIIVDSDSGLMVVHSVPGGHPTQPGTDIIRIEPVNGFFAPEVSRSGEIMRIELDKEQRNRLTKLAIEKVRQKIPFDHNYDLSDTSSLYCTELIQLLYKNIGIDLAQGRVTHISVPGMTGDYIMPSDIHQNLNLKQIYIY